jgi:histone H3/H4
VDRVFSVAVQELAAEHCGTLVQSRIMIIRMILQRCPGDMKGAMMCRTYLQLVLAVLAVSGVVFGDEALRVRQLTPQQAREILQVQPRAVSDVIPVETLSVEIAAILASNELGLEFPWLTEVTPDVARALSAHRAKLVLHGATKVQSQAAVELAKHAGPLQLQHERLSADVLLALSAHRKTLELGISDVTVEVARALETFDGVLDLWRADRLERTVAEILARRRGILRMKNVTALDDDAAAALAGAAGQLQFSLTRLSHAGLAARLSTDSCHELCEVTPAALEQLTAKSEDLWLSLDSISDEQAVILAKHRGRLTLKKTRSVSAVAEDLLALHEGPLQIPDLQRLQSAGLARKLARHASTGGLRLQRLEDISQAALRGLVEVKEGLVLGISEVTVEQAEVLQRRQRWLSLPEVRRVSPEVSRLLAQTEGVLWMWGLEDLSDELLAVRLVRGCGRNGVADLSRLTAVTPECLASLATCEGKLRLGLTELTARQAEYLARHIGTLELPELRGLTLESELVLARHTGPVVLPVLQRPVQTAELAAKLKTLRRVRVQPQLP